MTQASEYPAEWETDVVLADGSTAHIRPIRPDDRDRLNAFHSRQSPESIYFRYFRFRPELTETELVHLTTVDYFDRMAFVAIRDDDLIAVARYEPWGDNEDGKHNQAEVAFFVDGQFGGRGLATILLEFLAAAARRRGLDGFTATVLPENYGMLRVFRKAGFDVSTRFADGVIEVTLGITITEDTVAAIERRAQKSIARSVARILEPASVAVVGPSRRPGSVGNELLRHLLAAPFAGTVAVVHREAAEVLGIPAVRRVTDLPDPPDLAVVVVPGDQVEAVTADCVEAGVGALLVISAGFADAGTEGVERQKRLVSIARAGGVRLVGPNAFGVANTDPTINLRAMFLPVQVNSGRLALLSQSGPLGAAVLNDLDRCGVGISTFAALGNRADVSVNDVMQYWATDERTSAIALYIENYGNLRTFTEIAREISMVKPIISVGTADAARNTLLEQSGVILVDEVSDLAQQARLAIGQPLPAGRRVAVVSNTSSVARLAVAACRRAGLDPRGPDDGAVLVGDVDHLDAGSTANLSIYERAVSAAALSADVDAVLVALVPSLDLPITDLRTFLTRVSRAVAKPIVAAGLVDAGDLAIDGIPTFTFPEGAAVVLGRMARYAEWRRAAAEPAVTVTEERAEVIRASVRMLLGDDPDPAGRTLDSEESQSLLAELGAHFARSIDVRDADGAVVAARELGYPVAVKVIGLESRTVGESGGTALDLHDESQLLDSIGRMSAQFGDAPDTLTVQVMAPSGLHLNLELTQDFEDGAKLSIGPGGSAGGTDSASEILALPASRTDIARLCAADWIVRRTGPETRAAIEQWMITMAEAAAASPELALIRMNPLLAGPDGAIAVDGEIRIRPWPTTILDGVRHL